MSEAGHPVDHQRRTRALKEIYRRDFRRFAREQIKIRPLAGGALIPLILTESQELCYTKIERQRFTQGYVRGVALKPRQSGFSTLCEGIMFWLAIFHENVSTLLVAADDKSTKAIFRMTQLMYETLDRDLAPLIRYNNKEELDFTNPDKHTRQREPGLNSRMEFQTAKNAIAGTGTTRQGLHLSETGKWSEDLTDDLVTSLMPSIQRLPGTHVLMESTAFEGGDFFREMCERAEQAEICQWKGDDTGGGFDYFFHFAPWWSDTKNSVVLLRGEQITLTPVEKELQKYAQKGFGKEYPHLLVPDHTITPEQFKFRRLETEALKSEDNFEQEYPRSPKAAWISRDNYVFDRRALQELRKELAPPMEFVDIDNGPRLLTQRMRGNIMADRDYIAIWKRPEEGHTYDIGIDVAMGTEDGDWSVAEVLDRETREQVAEYHKHILPIDYARELYWLGKVYNTAQLVVEMNGPGIVTGHDLDKMSYPYIYIWRNVERFGLTPTSYAGWQTNHKSKQIIVSFAADGVIHGKTVIHSRVLWEEMCLFVRIGEDQYRASRGNDDCVMGYMIAIIGGEHEGHVAPAASATPVQDDVHPALRDRRDPARQRARSMWSREKQELMGMR